MAAFIFSQTSSEIVFCFPEAKDLRFCGLERDESMNLLNVLKQKYHGGDSEKTLKIYEVEKSSLQEFAPEDDRKYNFENFPHEHYRRTDLELQGSAIEDPDETDDMFKPTNGDLNKLQNRFTHLQRDNGSTQNNKAKTDSTPSGGYEEFKESSELMRSDEEQNISL